MQIKNPIVWKMECFQMVGFSDSMSIIRYDSIRDYHVMNVRDLVFVMAAAGDLSQIKSWHLSYFGASLCLLCLEKSFSEYILVRSLSLPACFPHILTDR